MFNVTTFLPHNLLQTNPCIRHNFSTQVFRKRAAQLHYVGPELRYIFWPPFWPVSTLNRPGPSWVHPVFYSMGAAVSSPGAKMYLV